MTLRKLALCWLFLTSCCLLIAQNPSEFIHVDQFGYLSLAEKVAVIANPQVGSNANTSYTPGGTLQIRNAQTGTMVWSGAPQSWNNGATHDRSGDQGWWLDFSDLTATGDFYIFDPTTNERSPTFTIDDDVYTSLMADAGRTFFYNRCNYAKAAPYAEPGWTDGMNFANPLQDTECSFVNDRENAALRRDLSGGWFDAGDYNKYVSFAQSAVHDLLWAYQESPSAFTDTWNIPESGNGIPDVLDEVKWEMDWLLKMINPDGSVINKMGSISFSENAAAPPSNNQDRRYYGPTCTSASIAAAAMLAHAAEVFAQIPAWSGYANQLETAAISTFNYWLVARNSNSLEYDCDDGTINAGDADRNDLEQKEIALTAAAHLFSITGEQQYADYLADYLQEAESFQNGFWGPYKNPLTSALLYYAALPNANVNIANQINDAVSTSASNNWNGYWGFNTEDLYRAFMPDWSYHWGSNSIVSHYANLNRLLIRYNLNTVGSETYNRKAAGMLHYLHGVNPFGIVYLSGMEGRGAARGIQEIYHTWFNDGTDWDNSSSSLFGPAPGFVSGGPNKDFSLGNISPPAGEPSMKAYKDWNTGFPENSWEITEPAIYYQAAYIRNLAAQMVLETALPVVYGSPLSAVVQDKDVLLQWLVETELNAASYVVERLSIRDEWVAIGEVAAQGQNRYRFLDEAPITGPNSYRLKQVDFDGTTSYSNVATVRFNNAYEAIQLYPNPLENALLYIRAAPVGASVRIYNTAGKLVHQQVSSQENLPLDLSQLPAGWYGIELIKPAEGSIWSGRFMKH